MSDADDIAARETSRFASRKFLLACSVVVAAHVALYLGKLDAAGWIDLLKWTVGLYCGGNVLAVAAAALEKR